MNRSRSVPRVPTLPRGEEIARYGTYLEAQQAVDALSDGKFPVEAVTIVGIDLRMVERVTGRLTYGRVALAGLASGAWFGLFVGLLMSLLTSESGAMFLGIGLGAGFGLLFSVLSYAVSARGKRDFTSSSQIVAASYALLCAQEVAPEAMRRLGNLPAGGGRPVPPAPPAAARSTEQAPDLRWKTPAGAPRYGAMREDINTATSPAQVNPAGADHTREAAHGSDATESTPEPGVDPHNNS